MQTTGKAQSLKRFLFLEALTDRTKNWHFAFSPVNATAATFGLT
jgi:hypothetical protein